MASLVLETTRAAHEELEQLERLAVRELQRDPVNARDRIYQSHRINNIFELIVTTSKKLVETYEDKDGARKKEISTLITPPDQDDIFERFDDRLKEIRESHQRYHSAFFSEADDHKIIKEEPGIKFSDEEAHGRVLDLRGPWNEFRKSKFGSLMEYSAYVGTFSQTEKITCGLRATRQYNAYLMHILDYLTSFLHRTEPLQDLQKIFTKLENEFEEQWANGEVLGWENKDTREESMRQEPDVNLHHYSTSEELEELGLETLKEALTACGLKCGGTVQQRAARLFLLKHTTLEQLDRKHFAPSSASNAPSKGKSVKHDLKRENALAEVKMRCLCEILDEVIVRTKANAEKKLTLNYDEMEVEREKLPMGWDGKPVPYWLNKLHGLGQESEALRDRKQAGKG